MTSGSIGIFDSGVGGVSVLSAVRNRLPSVPIHYVADSAHAPYGERSDAHVIARSRVVAAHLVRSGAQALVVACNTATAVAADDLRAAWPRLPIIGVEPGIKPAVAASRSGRIGVMATSATLRSARFQRLLDAHRGEATIHLQACPGLAVAIEAGRLDDPTLQALVQRQCRPLADAGVDTVVLGCTHYVFARHFIEAALGPTVLVLDTADAVARQVAAVWAGLRTSSNVGAFAQSESILLHASGDVVALGRIARQWLGLTTPPLEWLGAVSP